MSKKEILEKIAKIATLICAAIAGGLTLSYIWQLFEAKIDKLNSESEFYSSQARFTQKLNCKEDD